MKKAQRGRGAGPGRTILLLALSLAAALPLAWAVPGLGSDSSGASPVLRRSGIVRPLRLPSSRSASKAQPDAAGRVPSWKPSQPGFPHLLMVPPSFTGTNGPHRMQRGYRLEHGLPAGPPNPSSPNFAGNAVWRQGEALPPTVLSDARRDRALSLLRARTSAERIDLLKSARSALEPETVRVLVLRVDFLQNSVGHRMTGGGRFDLRRDEAGRSLPVDPAPHDRKYFQAHMEALQRYYRAQTRGGLVIQADVFPAENDSVYHLPDTFKYGPWIFSNSNPDIFQHAIDLVGDALAVADSTDPTLDFSRYLRPDGRLSVIIAHAGADLQSDINSDSPWDIPSFNLGIPDPFVVQDSININFVMVIPETVTQDGWNGALNGVITHEFGHQLGFYDLYDVTSGLTMDGAFSLMDAGNDMVALLPDSTQPGGVVAVHGILPTSLDPWHRWLFFSDLVDWVTVSDSLRGDVTRMTATLPAVESSNRLLYAPLNVTEDYLIENRHWDLNGDGDSPVLKRDRETGVILGPVPADSTAPAGDFGYDEYDHLLPGQGICIWHIDWRAINAGLSYDYGGVNLFYNRRGVGVQEADGIRDIGAASEEYFGGPLDPYFLGGYTCLGPTTVPNSGSNDGAPSGLSFCVPDSIANVMRVEVTSDRLPGPAQVVVPGEPEDGQVLALDLNQDGDPEMIAASKDSLRVYDYTGKETAVFPTGRITGPLAGRADVIFPPADPPSDQPLPVVAGLADGYVAVVTGGYGQATLAFWPDRDAQGVLDSLATTPPVLLGGGILVGCRDGWIRMLGGSSQALTSQRLVQAGPGLRLLGARNNQIEETVVFWATDRGEVGHVLLTPAGAGTVVRWDRSGSPDAQFPVSLLSAPLEGASSPYGYLSVWRDGSLEWRDADGNLLPGWPASIGSAPAGEALVCDADHDGQLETVLAGEDGNIHVFGRNGVERVHWPKRIWSEDDTEPLTQKTGPRAVDVNGDELAELVILRADGLLVGFDEEAQPVRTVTFSSGTQGSSGPTWIPAGAHHGPRLALGGVWTADNTGTVTQTALSLLRAPEIRTTGAGLFAVPGGNDARTRAYPSSWVPEPKIPAEDFDAASLRFYPNPLHGDFLTLGFVLGKPARVTVTAFDVAGRKVAEYETQGLPGAGGNQVRWDLSSLASGVYQLKFRVEGDGFRRESVRKVAVVR